MAAAFFWKSNKKMESPSRSDHSFVCSQCHHNNHILDYQHDNDSINKSNKKMAVPRPIPPFGGTRSSAAHAATALRMSKDDSNVGVLGDGVAQDPLKDASETGRDAAVGSSELPLYNDDNPEKSRGEAKKDKPKNAQKRTKLKVRNSVSETHLDRILRLGSMGKVNGTNSLARGLGGYQTLVAVKTAIDTTAGWRTPPLSGTQKVQRQKSTVKQKEEEEKRLKEWLTEQNKWSDDNAWALENQTRSDSRSSILNDKGEWTSPAYLNIDGPPFVPEALGAKRSSSDSLAPLAGSELTRKVDESSSDDESSDDDSVDAVLDIKRTLLNIGLFVATIAGWKGIWDAQDTNQLPWWTSVGIGIFVYVMRFKVDDVLDTHDVHSEDWFELFSKMPVLSRQSASEYGKIYLSSGLVFVSSLFIWRGVWTGFDAAGLDWISTLIIGTVSYTILSVLQLELEIQRSIEDPDRTRSPSLFAERETLLTPLTLVPEEFHKESDSSDDSDSLEQAPPAPPPPPPPPTIPLP